MRRFRPATAALVTAVAVLTSCGDDEPAGTASDPDPVTIEITVEDGTVEPSGERIEIAVGQRIELVVRADSSGEIHVHSEPEQELEYAEGTTTLPLTIDKPGVVDIEAHDPEQVIVRLQVE
jgi:FtsP/CotA-like multicopper oxidase with cupredoxin domain